MALTKTYRCLPLSVRGQKQAATGQKFQQFEDEALNAYHPVDNPDGVVNLGIAENTLMYNKLADYFEHHLHLTYYDFTYGISHRGDPGLRNALADLFNTHFNPHKPVLSDQIVLGAGLVAIASQLAGALANPGDGILLAAPYYYGFDWELTIQHDIVPVAVSIPQSDMFTSSELAHLEKALEESKQKGIRIKAVILCNPHNPLGRPYPKNVIIDYCKFCEKHNLHLICDEIYALSVFSSRDIPNPEPFVSALSIDLESNGINPSRIHILYGMSKDFNCNGFRVGVLVTSLCNESLIHSMIISTFFSCAASPATSLWSTMLSDKPFLDYFLETNRLKLQEAYNYITSWLRFHKMSYIPSSAGHFVLVDMRPVLFDTQRYGPLLSIKPDQDMYSRESALLRFLAERGVWLTPGSACHMDHGWFRFTFSTRRDFVNVALARIEDGMGWKKWPELEKCDEFGISSRTWLLSLFSKSSLVATAKGISGTLRGRLQIKMLSDKRHSHSLLL